MAEWVADLPPIFPNALEGILLDQDLDAGVLLVQAAVEQPGIGRLSSIGAGVDEAGCLALRLKAFAFRRWSEPLLFLRGPVGDKPVH